MLLSHDPLLVHFLPDWCKSFKSYAFAKSDFYSFHVNGFPHNILELTLTGLSIVAKFVSKVPQTFYVENGLLCL